MIQETILQWGSIALAILAIGALIYKALIKPLIKIMGEYKALKAVNETYKREDEEILGRIDRLGVSLTKEIHDLRDENTLLFKGTHACLDGLQQMKCNGPVTVCKEEFDDYMKTKFAAR